uniref:Uncharacterized protein n=1 Tax=Cacopsylla melanoneura TaxID=428564 RepID=A0A8D8WEK7_9HEMI
MRTPAQEPKMVIFFFLVKYQELKVSFQEKFLIQKTASILDFIRLSRNIGFHIIRSKKKKNCLLRMPVIKYTVMTSSLYRLDYSLFQLKSDCCVAILHYFIYICATSTSKIYPRGVNMTTFHVEVCHYGKRHYLCSSELRGQSIISHFFNVGINNLGFIGSSNF